MCYIEIANIAALRLKWNESGVTTMNTSVYEEKYLDQYYDRLEEEEREFNLEFDRELWEDEVL